MCVRQGHLRAKEGNWAADHADLAPLSRRFHAVFTPFFMPFRAVFTPFSRRFRADLTPLSHRNDSEIGFVPRRSLCEVTPNRNGATPHRRDRCGRCGRCPPSASAEHSFAPIPFTPPPPGAIPPFFKCAVLLVFVARSTPHRCKRDVGFCFRSQKHENGVIFLMPFLITKRTPVAPLRFAV